MLKISIRSHSKSPALARVDEKCLKEVQKVKLTPSSIKILSSYLKVLNIANPGIIWSYEVSQILSYFKKNSKEIVEVTKQINEGLSQSSPSIKLKLSQEGIKKLLLIKNIQRGKKELSITKIHWFGKGKISSTAVLGSFQTQVRPFAKFLIRIFTEVKKLKSDCKVSETTASATPAKSKEWNEFVIKPQDITFSVNDKGKFLN